MSQKRRKFIRSVGASTAGLFLLSESTAAERPQKADGMHEDRSLPKNEVAFAKGELPNFLNETILDGSKRVIVTDSANVPEDFGESDYDLCISHRECDEIESDAIDRYKDKFGVNPDNPQVDIVNGTPRHVEEVRKQVKAGELTSAPASKDNKNIDQLDYHGSGGDNFLSDLYNTGSEYKISYLSRTDFYDDNFNAPHAINDEMTLHVVPASDSGHAPGETYRSHTSNAWAIFANEFNISISESVYFGYWDASGEGSDSSDLMYDMATETSGLVSDDSHLVTGWVDFMDNNGIATNPRPFSVNACRAGGFDWNHERIVQHELSHNFGAPDRSLGHDPCVMTYYHAKAGTDFWCDTDHDIIDNSIN